MKCECGNESLFAYFASSNERGWMCMECNRRPGEPAGYCPELDRDKLADKVESLLMQLSREFVSISNNDHGERICSVVTDRCGELRRYDQYTICREIFASLSSHGDYWKEITDGILAGSDPRSRCDCGKLSTVWTLGKTFCEDCWRVKQ